MNDGGLFAHQPRQQSHLRMQNVSTRCLHTCPKRTKGLTGTVGAQQQIQEALQRCLGVCQGRLSPLRALRLVVITCRDRGSLSIPEDIFQQPDL